MRTRVRVTVMGVAGACMALRGGLAADAKRPAWWEAAAGRRRLLDGSELALTVVGGVVGSFGVVGLGTMLAVKLGKEGRQGDKVARQLILEQARLKAKTAGYARGVAVSEIVSNQEQLGSEALSQVYSEAVEERHRLAPSQAMSVDYQRPRVEWQWPRQGDVMAKVNRKTEERRAPSSYGSSDPPRTTKLDSKEDGKSVGRGGTSVASTLEKGKVIALAPPDAEGLDSRMFAEMQREYARLTNVFSRTYWRITRRRVQSQYKRIWIDSNWEEVVATSSRAAARAVVDIAFEGLTNPPTLNRADFQKRFQRDAKQQFLQLEADGGVDMGSTDTVFTYWIQRISREAHREYKKLLKAPSTRQKYSPWW